MSIWKYCENVNYDKVMGDWKYYGIDSITPNFEQVIGDLDLKQKMSGENILTVEKKDWKISTKKDYNSLFYKIEGYIECENEGSIGYVRIIKRKKTILWLFLLLVLALLIGGGYWWLNRDTGPKYDDDAIAYKMPEGIERNDSENEISIPGYEVLPMQAGTSEVYVALVNIEGNPCNFKYTITMKDTGEKLYESDLIRPGMAVTTVKLNRKIAAGEYDIIIGITTTALNDHTQYMNSGEIEAKLVAK